MKTFAAGLLALCLIPATAQTAATPAYTSNPEFQKAKTRAQQEEKSANTRLFAADDWRKANKIAGGQCVECFNGIFNTNMKLGEWKQAMKAAQEMDAAFTDATVKALAHLQFGRAAIAANDGKKQNMQQMEEAHTGLVQAQTVTNAAYFYDGRILALMKKDPEAAEAFAAYAKKTRRDDPLLVRARHFAERPELARAQMVPAVVVTTLAGKQFNLDNMNGKVVLIDFWATWCGPCKQELPHIKKIAEQNANEPFEIISVSWDADETKWKDFIAANGMTWNQYRDTDHALGNAFGINAIPHYYTVDTNGALTAEVLGSGTDIEGRIRKLLKQAKDDRERAQATATGSGIQ